MTTIKKTGITRTRPDGGITSPGGIGPRRFPPPLGVQTHYGHSRYVPKWYKVLKLVIFLTFDVCAAIPPPPNVFSAPFTL